MRDVRPCLVKGCLQTSLSVKEAWIDIKKQPHTQLIERLCAIFSGKNEAAHAPLNQIIALVKRMGLDLCEARRVGRA